MVVFFRAEDPPQSVDIFGDSEWRWFDANAERFNATHLLVMPDWIDEPAETPAVPPVLVETT